MEERTLTTIKEEAERFFNMLGEYSELSVLEREDGRVVVEVHMTEPQLYIGERGQTLNEIQHILRLIMKKKLGERLPLYLDINNYQKNREHYLEELARTTADEVALLKQTRELPPMSPADRRIIHTTVSDRQDVVTDSAGEGAMRHVVIRPKVKE